MNLPSLRCCCSVVHFCWHQFTSWWWCAPVRAPVRAAVCIIYYNININDEIYFIWIFTLLRRRWINKWNNGIERKDKKGNEQSFISGCASIDALHGTSIRYVTLLLRERDLGPLTILPCTLCRYHQTRCFRNALSLATEKMEWESPTKTSTIFLRSLALRGCSTQGYNS